MDYRPIRSSEECPLKMRNEDDAHFGRPVVPLLNKIHRGASNDIRVQAISPEGVRPS
jgi:hypothetical protein